MTLIGMAAAAAFACAAYVVVSPRRATDRVAGFAGRPDSSPPAAHPPGRVGLAGPRGRALAGVLAGLGAAGVVGGVAGAVAGAVLGPIAYVLLGRLEPRAVAERRDRLAADVPVVAHLMAMSVAAGATPLAALEVAATAVGGPAAADLGVVAAHLRLGADAQQAWAAVDPAGPLGSLGRTVARSMAAGAPLVDALDRLASDLRERRRHDVDRRARAIGVRAAGPLGLCFLPAFLLVGVVPVVIGVAQHVLAPVLGL